MRKSALYSTDSPPNEAGQLVLITHNVDPDHYQWLVPITGDVAQMIDLSRCYLERMIQMILDVVDSTT